MPLPAFSNLPMSGSNARLFFTQYWDGSIARVYPSSIANSYGWSTITGVDSQGHGDSTLNADFGITSGGNPDYIIEHILDPVGLTAADTAAATTMVDLQNTITFAPSEAPGGIGNQVTMTRLLRSDSAWTGRYPQFEFTTQFANNKLTPNKFYHRFYFKTPANLVDIMARSDGYSAWVEIFAIKSNDSTMNDSRLSIGFIRLNTDTDIRFNSQFDNSGTRFTDGVMDTIQPFWMDRSDEGVIQPGTWYECEFEFKRSDGGKTDLDTGSYDCVLTNLETKARYPIAKRRGSQQLLDADETKHPTLATSASYDPGVYWGYYNYPFTRFMTAVNYTGGKASPDVFTMIFSNGEFWTKAPYILI
jgi:hypothetical protein